MRRLISHTWLLLFLLLLPLASPAQSRDSFFADLNEFLDMRAAKNYAKWDTTYIDRYPYKWDARLFLNTEGLHLNTDGAADTKLSTGMSNRVGVSLSYRGLGLSYTRAIGRKLNFGFGFSTYGTHLGFEYALRASSRLSGAVQLPGEERRKADAGDLTLLASNLNLFYSFNPRFSYAAAMKQTRIQRRSAGSVIAAVSWTVWDILGAGPDIISKQTSIQTFLEVTNLMYNRYSLGVGYGYNLVAGDAHWLFHASLIPMWTFYDSTHLRQEGETVKYRRPIGRYGITGTARAGIYYRWGTRWSVGLSSIVNQMSSSTSLRTQTEGYYHFEAQDWQARLSVGFRF
ncbi:MAG: DUF4421 family protein [Bacteroidales bacterium]|nr:DUF4421 family protein [Bacteroidales bacterium]